MEIFLCFCIMLFVLTFLAVMIKEYWRKKNSEAILPGDLFINESKNLRTTITSCRATKGSVINCSSKGVKVRLSRGGYFSGKVNGKIIELEGPKDKDWEEFDIKI